MNPLWNIDKSFESERVKSRAEYVPPTGTVIERAREILRRCEVLDAKFLAQAIEAESAGDHECCWFNMAARANNSRFIERVRADLAELEPSEA